MKTKILKTKGYWTLVVQDEQINAKYHAHNDKPIVLASMTEFVESGCWAVKNYRLRKNLVPSQYLEESVQQMLPKNKEEKEKIYSLLHTYYNTENKQTGIIYWPLFDLYDFQGDNPEHRDKKGKEQNVVARFSFNGARQRLKEQKEFWENFEKNDLTLEEIRLTNSHRQLNNAEIWEILNYKTKKLKP